MIAKKRKKEKKEHAIAEESTLYLPILALKAEFWHKKEKEKKIMYFLSNWMKGEIGLRYFQRKQESLIGPNYYEKVGI